jgi:hypothetical protein
MDEEQRRGDTAAEEGRETDQQSSTVQPQPARAEARVRMINGWVRVYHAVLMGL